MTIRVYVEGIGFAAPGLPTWVAAREVLGGRATYVSGPLAHREPDLLPPAERRRAGATVRLALAVAQEAVAQSGLDKSALASVFASSDGDGDNVHQICTSLASDALEISPTRFHNSVQNAASGYWSIATRCHAGSTTINGFDDVFAHGLLEAAVQVASEAKPMLLVSYDLPMPEPLRTLRPLAIGCGVALVLAQEPSSSTIAALELSIGMPTGEGEVRLDDPALESMRTANPAARALPLLAALARGSDAIIRFSYDVARVLSVRSIAVR